MDRKMSEKEVSRFMKLAGLLNEMEFAYGDEDEQEKALKAEDADYESETGDTATMGNID
jgi:hypothetical protein